MRKGVAMEAPKSLTPEEERKYRKEPETYCDANWSLSTRLFAALGQARRESGKHNEALVVVYADGRAELYAHNRKVKIIQVPDCAPRNEEVAVDAMIAGLPPSYVELFMPGYLKDRTSGWKLSVEALQDSRYVKRLMDLLKGLK
jgi:hypothetical protein